MNPKIAPCTDMATYGPAIFTREELEDAPEGSVFIDEEMDTCVKGREGEWVFLEEPRGDGDPGGLPIDSPPWPMDTQMGVLIVKEKAPPAMNRSQAIRVLAMRAVADHCDIQWDDSDVWEHLTELDGADVDDITEEACRIIRSVSECHARIEEAKRVLMEARKNPAEEETR